MTVLPNSSCSDAHKDKRVMAPSQEITSQEQLVRVVYNASGSHHHNPVISYIYIYIYCIYIYIYTSPVQLHWIWSGVKITHH